VEPLACTTTFHVLAVIGAACGAVSVGWIIGLMLEEISK